MSQVNTNSIYDASGGSNAVLYGVAAPANSMGNRNRIINGDMRIDQRNAGASVSAAGYCVDRWNINVGGSSAVIACQQVSDAPAGFSNSLRLTISTAATLSAAQFIFVRQIIEGYNIADLGWGTASAQAVTVSFWVKASITGTYSMFAINSAEDRSFVGAFSINSASTWEYKTVAIPGDTSGTWLTNNSNGIRFGFDLGSGSNFQGTANAWNAGWKQRTSGTVSLIGTTGATFYITGVQLEAGSVASPFERRDYGRELIMCQRYYEEMYPQFGVANTVAMTQQSVAFKATKRTTPTCVIYADTTPYAKTGTSGSVRNNTASSNIAATIDQTTGRVDSVSIGFTGVSGANIAATVTASSEL